MALARRIVRVSSRGDVHIPKAIIDLMPYDVRGRYVVVELDEDGETITIRLLRHPLINGDVEPQPPDSRWL